MHLVDWTCNSSDMYVNSNEYLSGKALTVYLLNNTISCVARHNNVFAILILNKYLLITTNINCL